MKIANKSDTIISPISSTVGGSIGLIRISGSNAIGFANQYFVGKNLLNQSGGRFFFGKLVNMINEVVDDVVLLLYKKPHSYTGEDVIEINCHGNPFIIEQIIELFLTAGCRMAEPGEFTKRAFLNGKIDLVQAEAVADLISAKSKAFVNYSLENVNGKLSNHIKSLRDDLIHTASLLELDLDFSEENFEIVTTKQVADSVKQALEKVNTLIESYQLGKILNKGVEVLITGKPNVGKSSLMNALLDQDRVIVSNIPGTTRDTIHEDIIINNILVRFIDTAGIHLTDNQIEAEGVDRARNLFEQSNIILLILDISRELTNEDHNLIQTTSSIFRDKLILVGNKADLKPAHKTIKFLSESQLNFIQISALKKTNIEFLKSEIISGIQKRYRDISEDLVITNQRQNNILKLIKSDLDHAETGLNNDTGFEFIAIDLRNAIDQLSEITGEISTDEILNNIFSNFCIGK